MAKSGCEIARFLYCSGVFEEEVAKTYNHIAETTVVMNVKVFLKYIADDSYKHAKMFKALSGYPLSFDKSCFEDCEKVLGGLWKNITENSKKIQEKSEINNHELLKLIDGLEKFEGFVAEEYLTALNIKTIELMTLETGLNLEPYRMIFEWIIEDEKRHGQILKTIRNLIIRSTSQS
ncbi:MAG: hypothetical protein N3F08_03280 [Crenarchaeota archaeon]|nr:hypothetical protein [Thermoproteota archaeon]